MRAPKESVSLSTRGACLRGNRLVLSQLLVENTDAIEEDALSSNAMEENASSSNAMEKDASSSNAM